MSTPKDSLELASIDLADLDGVTGGVTQAATDPNSAIATMLTGLLSSIQQLAQQQQSSGSSSQMMPMMMMMMMGNRNSQPAPAAPEVPVGQVTPSGWTRVS